MSMDVGEFRKFKAIVSKAASTDNDAELATFFRQATRMIQKHGYTWDDVFNKVTTVVDFGDVGEVEQPKPRAEPAPPPPRSDRYAGIERDFELAMDDASGSFLDTLEDIHSKWERDGRLSDRQLEVVRDAAARAVERHPGGRFR